MNAHETVASLVFELVPQWIASATNEGEEALQIAGRSFPFWPLRPLIPEFKAFKRAVEAGAPRWVSWLEQGQPPSAPTLLQEAFAMEWLRVIAEHVNWHKALSYTTSLSQRTFENAAITCNLVVSPGAGTVDITEAELQKLVATLAGSMQSFLRIDGELRLQGYEAIRWNDIHDAEDYKLYPEFLHPFSSILEHDEVSIHHTNRGDLLVLKRGGLRAARRKGQWRLYDPLTLKNAMTDLLANYWVGANAFEFLLDLSFKRHGALLVFDPEHVVLEHVVNSASVVAPGRDSADPLRRSLSVAIDDVRMGERNGLTAKKRIMMELASMDGALIFDERRILAIGAMIKSHDEVGSHAGARTTAARSALAFGGHPIKVSADGDIDVLFKGDSRFGVGRPMSLSFL